MDCYYRLQFHRRLLERQMPMVPKLSMPVCDVRDVAAAHIAAMTSPKAPGKSVKQFFRRINKWLLSFGRFNDSALDNKLPDVNTAN